MINLDNTKVKNLEPHYLSYMKDRVLKKVNDMSEIEKNPFTKRPIKWMLNNNCIQTEEFIEDLLTKNIDDLCLKYTEVTNYVLSCKFLFYSDFSVRKELDKVGEIANVPNMQNFRKSYIYKYNNPWIIDVIRKYPSYFEDVTTFKQLISDVENKIHHLNELIGEVIFYDLIKADERHYLLYNFGIEICPYCNRNFISKFKKNGKLRTTADLDHFYPKKFFTLFSLSLHNFIPSCQICNSRFKLAKGIEIVNPYNEKINYTQFKFKHNLNINSDASIFFDESKDFDIKIECRNNRYLNNIELFELEKLYNTHKPLVAEIVYKKESYNKSYQELFNNLFDEMSISEEEINLLLYGIHMDESSFHKKPLSKLIYDIVSEN